MAAVLAPVIAGALAGIGVTAAAASIIAEVVVIAIGLGISLISQLLFKPAQPKPSDVQTILRQATAPRFRAYGRVKVGGILMFANTKGGVFDRVIAMGSGEIDGVEEHWIDDQLVTLDGGGGVGGKYAGKARIEFRLGTDAPAPYGPLITAWPAYWTADHLGKGIPSAYFEQFQVKSEDMGNIWPQYANTLYRQVQRGAKIRTVAAGVLSAPVWNDLAAPVILDYLTHPDGLNLDDSWITNEIASWELAQSICSEAIALEAGGSENRYRIWNVYRFDERPADILARFLQACDGMIYPTPNRGIAIKVGKWETPTVTIDDDAILGFSEFGRGRDVLTTANIVRARFTSPDHDYQETDADPWIDDADVADRGEFAIDLDLFPVPSHAQCRRLMKLAAHRANPDWVGTLSCNLRALPVMGERFINVEISELGIIGTFEVLNVQLQIEGTILRGVQVQIASLSSAAYDWNVALQRGEDGMPLTLGEEGTPPAIPDQIIRENTIPEPTGVIVSMLAVLGSAARIAWDAPPDDFLEGEARYRPIGGAEWFAIPVAVGATAAVIYNIDNTLAYEFEMRFRSSTTSRASGWVSAGYAASAQVDLNFAADEYYQLDGGSTLAALVNVVRASTAYAEDLAGIWSSFAVDTARRTDRGLLVETARTNEIRNNSMQGGVVGSPGTFPTNWQAANAFTGCTRTISNITTNLGVIDTIDLRFAGTYTGPTGGAIAFETATQIPTVAGDVWALSVFAALVGGSLTNITNVYLTLWAMDSSGVFIAIISQTAMALTGSLERFELIATVPGTAGIAYVRPVIKVEMPTGAVIDLTLRIGWPQLEKAAFMTSPIRTTNAAVTRAADVVSLITPPSFESSYTLLGAGIPAAPTTSAPMQSIISIGDGTLNNRWSAGRAGGVGAADLSAGGSTATISGGTWARDTSGSIAAAYSVSDQAYSLDGAAVVLGTSALVPAGINTARIGNAGAGTEQWNGYVERVIIWPNVRLPNGELQRLTA